MSEFVTRLAILCGLPQSGKSTYARELRRGDPWVVICPDEIRWALYGQDYFQAGEPFVWANAELMARSLLRNEHMVLIDATNSTAKRRRQWVSLAQEFDMDLCAYVLNTPAEECIRRANRNNKLYMKWVIERMAKQFEPVTEEGIYVMWEGDVS